MPTFVGQAITETEVRPTHYTRIPMQGDAYGGVRAISESMDRVAGAQEDMLICRSEYDGR